MEVSSWENRLFLWAIYTMAMLVITRGYPPKKSSDIPQSPSIHTVFPDIIDVQPRSTVGAATRNVPGPSTFQSKG